MAQTPWTGPCLRRSRWCCRWSQRWPAPSPHGAHRASTRCRRYEWSSDSLHRPETLKCESEFSGEFLCQSKHGHTLKRHFDVKSATLNGVSVLSIDVSSLRVSIRNANLSCLMVLLLSHPTTKELTRDRPLPSRHPKSQRPHL